MRCITASLSNTSYQHIIINHVVGEFCKNSWRIFSGIIYLLLLSKVWSLLFSGSRRGNSPRPRFSPKKIKKNSQRIFYTLKQFSIMEIDFCEIILTPAFPFSGNTLPHKPLTTPLAERSLLEKKI